MNTSLLHSSNLTVGHNLSGSPPLELVRTMSVQVPEGKFIAVMGLNGSGKSTLLHTLCGLLAPLQGQIYLKGKNMLEYSKKELARNCSIVMTQRPLTSFLSGMEVLRLGRQPHQNWFAQHHKADRDRIDQVVRQLALDPYLDKQIGSLSDGQLQRLMIGKALVQDTPLLLLDEPTAFLDVQHKVSLLHMLWSLSRTEHKSIIISTHEIEAAVALADELWIIDAYKNLQASPPEKLLLNGSLGVYFGQESGFLDKKQGSIQWGIPVEKPLIGGEAHVSELTAAALAKHGIHTLPEGLAVHATTKGWLVKKTEEPPVTYHSLQELIDYLDIV